MEPQLLRNASHLVMTVRDKDTGELYYKDDTPYANKSIFDEDENVWSGTTSFMWDGTDASGEYVPSGTVAHVRYDVQLPYNDAKQNAAWEFDITVDYTAPKLESIVYDKDAKTLTVTASDDQYLQGIYIGTTSDVLKAEAYSSDEKGASFTATFDVTELEKKYDYLSVVAIDYATNETEVVAPLFDSGKDVKVTVVSPTGTEVHEMKSGDTFTVPAAEDYDNAQFQLWCTNPVEKAETDKAALEACGTTYEPGDEILLKSDVTIYALYAYGATVQLETTDFYYATPQDYTGVWALVGLDYDFTTKDFLTDTPYALDSALAKKNVVADFGATVGEEYIEFFTNEKSIRWEAEKLDDGNYTFKNVVSGEYLGYSEDGTEIATLKEVTAFAKWNVTSNAAYGTSLRTVGVEGMALIYDSDSTNTFKMVDNTFDWSFGIGAPMYESDLCPVFMYKATDEDFDISYYTTTYCSHEKTELRDAKEATYGEDGYTGDTYCSICGKLLQKGEVIPATGYPTCSFKTFKDCDSKWYHEAVDFAVANGLMNGVGRGCFDPEGSMTRAMMVTVLYRMAGSPEVKGNSTFTDVPAGQWYSDAITWAQDNGIVLGVLTDKFAPDDFVTREQIATILWRYEGKPAAESKFTGFKDAAKISDYAKTAMAWAVNEGIFNGDNGNLKPTDDATRAEFACIIMRYLGGSYACKDLMK